MILWQLVTHKVTSTVRKHTAPGALHNVLHAREASETPSQRGLFNIEMNIQLISSRSE